MNACAASRSTHRGSSQKRHCVLWQPPLGPCKRGSRFPALLPVSIEVTRWRHAAPTSSLQANSEAISLTVAIERVHCIWSMTHVDVVTHAPQPSQ